MKGDIAVNTPRIDIAQKGKLSHCMNHSTNVLERLSASGIPVLQADALEGFCASPGLTLLFLGDDPERSRETIDLLVIAPEIRALFENEPVVSAVLLPRDKRDVESLKGWFSRWGVKRLPAVVLLVDGDFWGALEGLRDWEGYQAGLLEFLLHCRQEFEIQNEGEQAVRKEERQSSYRTIALIPVARTTQDA